MTENKFIKLLTSIPVILVVLYFIPFLGICLLIFRYFVYREKKITITPIYIAVIGLIILIPQLVVSVLELLKIKLPYISDFVSSAFYANKLIGYSKFLITVGVIFFILSFVVKKIMMSVTNKLSNGVRNYIQKTEEKHDEIYRANDMELKVKREQAKNTNYVHCPYCGSDNLVSTKTGICKYCRRVIENPNYHE